MSLTYKAFQEGIRIAPNGRTTDPASGKVGEVYWNTADSVLRVCVDPAPIWTDAFVLPSGQLVPANQVDGSTIRWDAAGTPRWVENNQFLTLANRAFAPSDATQGTDLELQAGNTTGGTNDGANLVLIGGSSLGGSQGKILVNSDYIKSVIATGLAGRNLNVEAGDADTGSGFDGGNLNVNGGLGDGSGVKGKVLIGSLTELTVIDATNPAFLVSNSSGRGIVVNAIGYDISTPTETLDATDSEGLVVSSGDVSGVGSVSGDVYIKSGQSAEATGNAGIFSSNTGADDYNSGMAYVKSGNATGTGLSGDVLVFSGQTVEGKSGQVMIVTGNVSGTGDSGDIVLLVGQSVGGARGNILISAPFVKTEDDDTDNTESFNIKTGDASGFDPDVLQEQQLAVGGWFALQDWGTNEQYADSFVASASYVSKKVSLTLRRVGAPVADLYVAIVPDDGFGAPDETTILASTTVDMSAITDNSAGEVVEFPLSTSLTISTTYYIMFYLSDPGAGSVDSSNYIDIQYVAAGFDGYWDDIPPDGTWTASGGAEGFWFEVYEAGAGKDSGDITLQTGTAAGTRGKVIIDSSSIKLKDGSEGTVGHVWKSTDTDGSGNWDEDTSLFIFPGSTVLSGTYRGNVLVEGNASIVSGAYFYGDLTVKGSLTSTDGSFIIVYGDLWIQEQMILDPTTGIAAGEIRVYRDMTVLDQLAAGTSISMVSDEASADIYVDGSFFAGSDVILKPSDDATSPTGGNFYVGGNVTCDGIINISGGHSTGSADGGDSGEMIVQGHCTVNTILAVGGDSVSGIAGASSDITFENGATVERLDVLVGVGTAPAATGTVYLSGECRISDFRQTNMASAKIMPFLSTRQATLIIDTASAKCTLYDGTGTLFKDISSSGNRKKLWRYDASQDIWIALGGGSLDAVIIDNTDSPYAPEAGIRIFADASTAAITVTLPPSPEIGNTIDVWDYNNSWDTATGGNNVTVDRNGNNIDGVASNLILDVDNGWVSLVYVDSTVGWRTQNG